jgi:RNA polymerase sigma-70 factor (ECF subfamily)
VRLRAFVRSVGAHADWVDDIAQEALIKAYRNWDSFDQTRDFGKWVRGIAANNVRNEIRKNARHQRLLNSDLAVMMLDYEERSRAVPETPSIEAVRECLDKLTPTSRTLIQGRYRDGFSAPELAKTIGKSADNVRQILMKIRRQLRSCIEQRMASEVSS